MRWIITTLLVVLAVGRAEAGSVSVIVTGEAAIQSRLSASATRYLEAHGHAVKPGEIGPSAISNLLDCLAIDDAGCARSVIDQRSRASAILAVRTEVKKGTPPEITVIAYWIPKGHSPISMRRVCEKCSDEALDSMFDAILTDLVRSSASGRLVLRSRPAGLLAVLDNQPIGTTPLERDVPVGQHQLGLVQNGRPAGQRYIAVAADERLEIEMPVDAPGGAHRSRVLPVTTLGLGIAGMIAGGVLYATSESPTGLHPTYRDTKTLGIVVGAGGAVLVGVGVLLLLRGDPSGPTLDVTAGGASVGWIGRF